MTDTLQEEPVSGNIDFEQELYKAFGQVKDFTLCMQIAKWFYDMGKNNGKEPVGEDLEEAAKNHAVERFRTTRDRELAEKCKWSFKAGAQWQKKKEYTCYEEAFEDGASWKKEEMMAKAVETTFNVSLPSGLYDKLWIKGCKEGDKLLVIKKDEL